MYTICCIAAWIIIILIAFLFLVLAVTSNLLRDDIDNIDAFMKEAAKIPRFVGKEMKDIPRPFSLARTQFGIWTVIVASTYVYLVICSVCTCGGCFLKIADSATALALLGISAGTAGLASIIDQSQSEASSAAATPSATPAANPRTQNEPSKGFFMDILSDENGVSIHRFQNLVWTIVAIAVYLTHIDATSCKLPELDGTLLALSGISSAAYLGLKMNENKPKKS